MVHLVFLWLAVAVITLLLEAATMSLVSVWCSAGALVTVFAAYFGVIQLLLFIVLSIAGASLVRPLAKQYIDPYKVATNADRLLGMEARVTEDIDNSRPSGAVYVDGKTWTARSADGRTISAGEVVEVQWMEGVKLIVQAKAAVPAA